jgi:hypothetical protein
MEGKNSRNQIEFRTFPRHPERHLLRRTKILDALPNMMRAMQTADLQAAFENTKARWKAM